MGYMLTLEEFRLMKIASKRDYLALILKKYLKKDATKIRSMENFLLNAEDEELENFYGAMINSKKWDKLRSEKVEEVNGYQGKIMELSNQFWKASLKYRESEENIKEEKEIQQLETLFED